VICTAGTVTWPPSKYLMADVGLLRLEQHPAGSPHVVRGSHDIEPQPGPVSVRLVAAGEGYQKAATGVVRVYEAASLSPGPRCPVPP
jgi:hypothetical protein